MTDGEQKKFKEAYNLVVAGAHKVKVNSDMWVQMVGMAMAFGYVLDEPGYREQCHLFLDQLRRLLGPPVTDVGQ